MKACNICGSRDFVPGPRDRLSATGKPPRCIGCGSLERHRTLRALGAAVPAPLLAWRRAIQFAPDVSFDPAWFAEYETSQFEGENSLDVRAIDRPEGVYDFISLGIVFEFVDDDRRGFREIARIASDACILHLSFGSTMTAPTSTHYDEPYGPFNRYHEYGEDFEEWFEAPRHGFSTLKVLGTDPVTALEEPFFFLCRQRSDAETLRVALRSADLEKAV